MKNKITLGLVTLVLTAIITSCSVSNDVASNRKIQKRKYNKGFFVGNDNVAFGKKNKKSETVYTIENDVVKNKEKVKIESITNSIENNAIAKEITTNVPSNETSNSTVESGASNVSKGNTSTELANEIVENKTISGTKKGNNLNKKMKVSQKEKKGSSGDDMLILLVILAFLIPFVAVGIKTDWDIKKVVICILLSILFWIPGVIYALLVVFDMI